MYVLKGLSTKSFEVTGMSVVETLVLSDHPTIKFPDFTFKITKILNSS